MSSHLFSAFRSKMVDQGRTFIETPDGRTITYHDLIGRTAQLAHVLVELGVKAGDRVAVQVEKSPEAVLLYLACVRAGAVFLPLNTAYTLAELEYFITDSEPSLVVCDPAKKDDIEALVARLGGSHVETLDAAGLGSLTTRANALPTNFDDVARGPNDLAAILYTSGTTGRSKGAMLSHDNLLSNSIALAGYWRFTAEDRLLHALPIFHIHGLFVAINCVLASGASIIFLLKFDANEIIQHMPRASVMMGVPTFYVRLLQHEGLNRDSTRHMRLFVSGSAPLLADTHRAWKERTGHSILERYGMTETNMSTSNPYDGDRIAGTVGLPLPGVSLRITDPDSGAPLEQGEIGVIEVRGPNVFKGYWRNPEKTKAEFREDGFFITGDLGLIDASGYVSIIGRGKDLIITGGYNVYPKEVETEIDRLPGVTESAVIGVPHSDFGEGVVAAVVPNGTAPLDESAILSSLGSVLAKFKQPKRIFMVDELPRNTMGKVQKNILRERYWKIFD